MLTVVYGSFSSLFIYSPLKKIPEIVKFLVHRVHFMFKYFHTISSTSVSGLLYTCVTFCYNRRLGLVRNCPIPSVQVKLWR